MVSRIVIGVISARFRGILMITMTIALLTKSREPSIKEGSIAVSAKP